MKDTLVGFKVAKLAKEKGFDIPHRGYNDTGELQPAWHHNLSDYPNLPYYFAPTQSLLQRWLREKHGIDVVILLANTLKHTYIGEVWQTIKGRPIHSLNISDFQTYEEALEKGLQEALKLIK